ncbi:FAD-dependent monooxygenase [Sphingobium phenoxybenzoativorans]|uniref:FAD-dependent monooxygenase n=1 Tax=Sphingobium phenoxybenzoativorans TaxID=1592790 RepID=A0A975Q2N2_9SPHN|nr:FAD-dependent monooxygenase [Sphingobium phenoxybenzoativorans]QUT07180.1 FAD-dependent monooxygenase [Sphingobium phenoxybenzoativorans]
MNSDKSIVIVGAGPTGLTAAILLCLRGYDPVVLDRRPNLVGYPAAHVANTRSMEVFAEIGVADRVLEQGDGSALSGLVVWVESLAGREYGKLTIQGAALDDRGPLSAYQSVNIPQTNLEAILSDRLVELGGTVRFGQEVIAARNISGGATVEVRAVADDALTTMKCDWVLGCDGAGSAVRRSMGIEMEGPQTIARFMTIYFDADLDLFRKGRRGILYWIGGPEVRGVFISFDKIGRSWAMLVPVGDLAVEAFSDAAAVNIVKKAIGSDDVVIELQGVSSWNMSAQVATAYRHGRILLAGDACHRFPPTGGLGMNTGIQDAHNLIWKLCAVLEGGADDTLLNTYEEERRPIARRNTDQSVNNLMKMAMIDEALGIQTLAPIAQDAAEGPIATWPDEVLGIDGNNSEAATKRSAVQHAIDEQAEHFAQGAGVDLGFTYTTGVLVPDGSEPPSSEPCDYHPDAHPGSRLPFSSIDGRFEASTLDRVAPQGVTLFALAPAWGSRAAAASRETGVAVSVVIFGPAGVDLGANAAVLLGISEDGAVAVRPDGHVLWRTQAHDAGSEIELVRAFRLCGRKPRSERSHLANG